MKKLNSFLGEHKNDKNESLSHLIKWTCYFQCVCQHFIDKEERLSNQINSKQNKTNQIKLN